VRIGDCVFLGPNVIFTNDIYPEACDERGELKEEYKITPTIVEDSVSIGAQSVIKCGITIGKGALIGLGSTVTRDIPERMIVYGEKARIRRKLDEADSAS
jgi:UDP-2-acetamido-3-amino-2,3-dideoxy-glucuronate N-acetyltransferase